MVKVGFIGFLRIKTDLKEVVHFTDLIITDARCIFKISTFPTNSFEISFVTFRQVDDIVGCRKVFVQAIQKYSDKTELLCELFEKFEKEEGVSRWWRCCLLGMVIVQYDGAGNGW